MSSPELIGLIAQHGGTLALAIFAIWLLNKTWADREERAREYAVRIKEFKDSMLDNNVMLRAALDRNTQAWVEVAVILRKWDE